MRDHLRRSASRGFRLSGSALLLISGLALAGCATHTPPPEISYDNAAPAVQTVDPPSPVRIVELLLQLINAPRRLRGASLGLAQAWLGSRTRGCECIDRLAPNAVDRAGRAAAVAGELSHAAVTALEVHERVDSLLCEVDSDGDRARSSHQASSATLGWQA